MSKVLNNIPYFAEELFWLQAACWLTCLKLSPQHWNRGVILNFLSRATNIGTASLVCLGVDVGCICRVISYLGFHCHDFNRRCFVFNAPFACVLLPTFAPKYLLPNPVADITIRFFDLRPDHILVSLCQYLFPCCEKPHPFQPVEKCCLARHPLKLILLDITVILTRQEAIKLHQKDEKHGFNLVFWKVESYGSMFKHMIIPFPQFKNPERQTHTDQLAFINDFVLLETSWLFKTVLCAGHA